MEKACPIRNKIIKKSSKKMRGPKVRFTELKHRKNSQTLSQTLAFSDLFYHDKETAESVCFFVFGFSLHVLDKLLKKGLKVAVMADPYIDTFKEIAEKKELDKNLKVYWADKHSLGQNSAFHPKIYLIKFSTFLRVVIGSANLFKEDWSEWSNVVWYKDMPISRKSQTHHDDTFKMKLNKFLKICLGSKSKKDIMSFVSINLDDYDFTKSGVELVTSVPFKLAGKIKDLHGLPLLAQIMKDNQPIKPFKLNNTRVYYSCSSVGGINFGFIYKFITAIAPNLALAEYTNKRKEQNKFYALFRLIYPTQDYVRKIENGNTHCLLFSPYTFNKVRFNEEILYQFHNNEELYGEKNFVSHSKFFIVTQGEEITDDTVIYLGSHNLTKSAWGKYSRDSYELQNYEMGVLFPPKKESAKMKQEIVDSLSFKIPSERYEESDLPYLS